MPTIHVCRWCGSRRAGVGLSCLDCGAATTARDLEHFAGWDVRPAVPDLAEIRFGRATMQLTGGLGPLAHIALGAEGTVVFSSHALVHADTAVGIAMAPAQRPLRAWRGGMPRRLLEASGPGELAVGAHDAGEVVAVPLTPGRSVAALPHRFLAATGGTQMRFVPSPIGIVETDGARTKPERLCGRWIDEYRALETPEVLLLHAPGEVLIHDATSSRKGGARLLVRPHALVWWDTTLSVAGIYERPSAEFYTLAVAWPSLAWVELTGSGRVAVATGGSQAEVVAHGGYFHNSALPDGNGRFAGDATLDVSGTFEGTPAVGHLVTHQQSIRRSRLANRLTAGMFMAVPILFGLAHGGPGAALLVALALAALVAVTVPLNAWRWRVWRRRLARPQSRFRVWRLGRSTGMKRKSSGWSSLGGRRRD